MNEKALRDNFCSAVWSSLFIDEYGDVFPCCKRVVGVKPLCDENGISINVSQSNFLIRAWNSLDMRKMRRDFLAGIYPARCQQCYQDDKLGLISLRQNLNRKFGHKIYDVVENTNDEGVAPLNLFFLDIRFGNKCNLACRMCSPQFSKNLIKEFKILNPTEMYIREKENDWFCDIEKLSDVVIEHALNLEEISVAGGEPFITEGVLSFLRKMSVLDVAKKIKLFFVTNLTIISEELLDLFEKFKETDLSISINGYGQVNEYIRWPSQWDVLDKNLRRLDREGERRRVRGAVSTTVQVYNIFSLHPLYQYLSNLKCFCPVPTLGLVTGHRWLDIQILPAELKELARRRIQDLQEDMAFRGDAVIQQQLKGIVQYMFAQDQSSYWKEFQKNTRLMDNIRNQKVSDYIPLVDKFFND